MVALGFSNRASRMQTMMTNDVRVRVCFDVSYNTIIPRWMLKFHFHRTLPWKCLHLLGPHPAYVPWNYFIVTVLLFRTQQVRIQQVVRHGKQIYMLYRIRQNIPGTTGYVCVFVWMYVPVVYLRTTPVQRPPQRFRVFLSDIRGDICLSSRELYCFFVGLSW